MPSKAVFAAKAMRPRVGHVNSFVSMRMFMSANRRDVTQVVMRSRHCVKKDAEVVSEPHQDYHTGASLHQRFYPFLPRVLSALWLLHEGPQSDQDVHCVPSLSHATQSGAPIAPLPRREELIRAQASSFTAPGSASAQL